VVHRQEHRPVAGQVLHAFQNDVRVVQRVVQAKEPGEPDLTRRRAVELDVLQAIEVEHGYVRGWVRRNVARPASSLKPGSRPDPPLSAHLCVVASE
jgi:hypothetical protein